MAYFKRAEFWHRTGATFPIGSKSRCVLYQCTHSRVANSTSSGPRQGPSAWKTSDLPARRASVMLDRVFSREEMDHIRRGVIPEVMEDK